MHMVKLRDDFYWTGVTDENLRVFDISLEPPTTPTF